MFPPLSGSHSQLEGVTYVRNLIVKPFQVRALASEHCHVADTTAAPAADGENLSVKDV